MVVRLNSSIAVLYIYIQLGIQRCDGPGRHRMLTMIDAYYSYYGILLIRLYGSEYRTLSSKFNILNWYSTDPDAIVSLHVKVTE